ncbi:MAG: choice-of-anchor V domain-containing protein, partial [Bacteroidia bacterium]
MSKRITIKHIVTAMGICALLAVSTLSMTNNNGAPAGYTNAPSEPSCASCHSGSLVTSGTNYNNVSLTGNFTGSGYIPDSTYTITLSYTHTGKTKFGYQLTCLDSDDDMAGSFALITGNNKSSLRTKTFSGNLRRYVGQTSSGSGGTGSASWSFEWTAPSSNVGDVTFYTVVNSANNNKGTGGDIIIAKEFIISPSTLLPVATASVLTSPSCTGGITKLKGSGTNSPTSWSWSISGGSPGLSTSQNPEVVMFIPGTHRAILTVKNSKGFSQPDTVNIVVKQSPDAFIAGGNTRTICDGDSVMLSVPFKTNTDYTWNTGDTTNAIWASDTGKYYVNVSAADGCAKLSQTIQVNFHPKPVATLTSNASLFNDSSCTGSSVILEANQIAFDSFYFYSDGVLEATSDNHIQSLPFDSTTVFGLRVRNSLGCLSDLSPYTVTARKKMKAPVVECTTTSPSSITFNWSSLGAHQGYEVKVNNEIVWKDPSSGPQGLSHLVDGLLPEDSVTISVRALDDAPCFYSAVGVKKCFSQSCDPLDVSVAFDSSVCFGDLWTVEVNGLKDKHFGLWIDASDVITDTVFQFNPVASRTFTLFVQDSLNAVCPAQEIELPLVVDRIQDIQLRASKIGAFCKDEEVTFTANETLENFDFYRNGTLVQSGDDRSYTSQGFVQDDSLYVVVTKGKCIDTSQNYYVDIELEPDASFTYTNKGSIYEFAPRDIGHASYEWDFGDGSMSSSDVQPTHDFASKEGETVDVKLEITTVSNCLADSMESLSLPIFSSVEDISGLGLEVYPNPVGDYLTLV